MWVQYLCLETLLQVTGLSVWILDTGLEKKLWKKDLVKLFFVKTRYNMSDIFTNNTIDDIVNFHHNKMAKEIKNQTGRVLESV